MQIVLLTGANGFVGTQIARRLLQTKEVTVLALIRAADAEEGARRLARESTAAWYLDVIRNSKLLSILVICEALYSEDVNTFVRSGRFINR